MPPWTPPTTYTDEVSTWGAADVMALGESLADYAETTALASASKGLLPFNVREAPYNTLVNGAGDAVAGFRAALLDAYDAIDGGDCDGAEILVPRGSYEFTASQTVLGQPWHVPILRDNITLRFEDGAVIGSSLADCSPFMVVGAAKPAELGWAGHWIGDPTTHTYYAFPAGTVLRRGAMSFTLNSAGDAVNFAVGDAIHIRTGQTTNANALSTEPDAELNEVASITGAVIGLRYPLVKDYQQEWFVGLANNGLDGNTGKSDTNDRGGANHGAAVFGVANIEAATLRNIKFLNYQFDMPGVGRYGVLALGAVIGLEMKGVRGRIGGSVMCAIEYRFARFEDFDVAIVNSSSTASSRWITTTATSCSDIVMRSIRGVGRGGRMAISHFHEGTANLLVEGFDLSTDAGADDTTPYSIRGRAYNQRHEHVRVTSGGTQSPVFVSPECSDPFGLSCFRDVQARCADAAKGISITAQGWSHADVDPATPLRQTKPGGGFTVGPTSPGGMAPGVAQPEFVYGTWLDKDHQTQVLGPIADNTMLWDASIYVQVAFDSDGTDRVTVGWDGVTSALVQSASMTDLSVVGDRPVFFNADYYRVYQGPLLTQPRTLKAYYVNSGSEPTVGKVFVTVVLHRTLESPT